MERNEIGVMLVSYNHGRYVMRAIESLALQDHGNIILCVIDNASTDDSRSIILAGIEKYREHFSAVHIHFSKVNLGAGGAISYAMEYFKNKVELLGLAASDDIALPSRCSKMADCLRKDPQATVVFAESQMIDDLERPVRKIVEGSQTDLFQKYIWESNGLSKPMDGNLLDYETLLKGNFIGGVGQMWRISDWFAAVGGFNNYLEDWESYLKAARNGKKSVWIDESLSLYRTTFDLPSYGPKRLKMQRAFVDLLIQEMDKLDCKSQGISEEDRAKYLESAGVGLATVLSNESYLLSEDYGLIFRNALRRGVWRKLFFLKSLIRAFLVKLGFMDPVPSH